MNHTSFKTAAGRPYLRIVLPFLCCVIFFLSGCRTQTESGQTDVEFTITTAEELPQELAVIIEENKEQEMRLTWTDGDEMYLIRGYGKQATGGYSIAVAGCTEDEELLRFDTRLLGPQEEDTASAEASYPYLVVKIAATEKEVVIE